MRNTVRKKNSLKLLDTLMPEVRQRILSTFFLEPDRHWYLTQLATHLALTASSLQRDLTRLSEVGILERASDGGRVYFRVNAQCEVFPELQSLMEKTVGKVERLLLAIKPFQEKILLAILCQGDSDPEALIIVGRADFNALRLALTTSSQSLCRVENIHCYWPEEIAARLRSHQPFLLDLLSRKKTFITGSQEDLNQLSPSQ